MTGLAAFLYGALLRLYPARVRESFAEEMADVFALALDEARQAGRRPAAGLLWRELADQPAAILLAYFHERRRNAMLWLPLDSQADLRPARRMARLLSLLPLAFYLSLLLFNEDVRSEPTPPSMLMGILSIFILVAWRWEKEGGLLALIGAPLLLVGFPLLLAVPVAGLLALPYLIIGWLFYSIGRYGRLERPADPARKDEEERAQQRLWPFYLAAAGLALAVILFFVISFSAASPQRFIEPATERCAGLPEMGRLPPVGDPPAGPLPASLDGYELYSRRVKEGWIFILDGRTERLVNVDPDGPSYYEAGLSLAVEGLEPLKATLAQLPADERVTWCGPERPDPAVVVEVLAYDGKSEIRVSLWSE